MSKFEVWVPIEISRTREVVWDTLISAEENREMFAPLNRPGDEHGTFIENNAVVSPPGYAEAYRQFVDNGWQGIGKSAAIDGQGLPYLVHSAVAEMWYSANMAFALCPLLTSGAIEAILRVSAWLATAKSSQGRAASVKGIRFIVSSVNLRNSRQRMPTGRGLHAAPAC